jgi:hypothetical protein
VEVSYRVARTEGAAWESSPPVAVRVIALPDPQTEDFSTQTPRSIRPGTPEALDYFSVAVWGQTSAIQNDDTGSPLMQGRILRTYANSGWTFTLHRLATQVSFDLASSTPGTIDVVYTFEGGQTIQQRYRTSVHVVFTDPVGAQRISSISFSAGMYSNMAIDNIRLAYF